MKQTIGIRLRRLEEGDREDFVMLEGDPDTAVLTGLKEGAEDLFRFCMDEAVSYAAMSGELFIGHMTFFKSSFTSLPGKPEAWEICFSIFPECRGMGLGRKILEEGIRKATEELEADVLLAGAFGFNSASIRLLESEGFVYLFSRMDKDGSGADREEKIFLKVLRKG